MSGIKPYKFCLIGCGVSGSILLLKLLETISPDEICVIDPAFDGGDLARRWPEVSSNSTWGDFLEFGGKLALLNPILEKKRDKYNPDDTTPVWELSNALHLAVKQQLAYIDANTCYVRSINYSTADAIWTIQTESPGCVGKLLAKTILYAPGGIPKQVNLGKPQIPLEVALDPKRLERYIEPGQHILLFGLSHSGVLVLKNLLAAGAIVSAIHRSSQPFLYQRDGVYNGIKQKTATFADKLVTHPNVTFIHTENTENVIRSYAKCEAIVSAIGFLHATNTVKACVDDVEINLASYDSTTGRINSAPATFGFGMAYPSRAEFEGQIYDEVGIKAFVNQLDTVIPAILSSP